MKRLLVTVTISVTLVNVNAQNAFEGFYGQISTGYENNSVTNTDLTMKTIWDYSVDYPGGNNPSNSSMPLVVGLGYSYSVTPKFLFGIGIDYSPIQTIIGNANINPPISTRTGTTYKVSNRLSLYITPGYVIGKDKLIYGKAGYTTQRLETTFWNAVDGLCDGNSIGKGNVNGYVLGTGYKQTIAKGFYGFGEVNYYKYGKASFGDTLLCDSLTYITNFRPSTVSYNFLIGVGYRF